MHSVITLFPVISKVITKEIMDNVQLEELESFQLSRLIQ